MEDLEVWVVWVYAVVDWGFMGVVLDSESWCGGLRYTGVSLHLHLWKYLHLRDVVVGVVVVVVSEVGIVPPH